MRFGLIEGEAPPATLVRRGLLVLGVCAVMLPSGAWAAFVEQDIVSNQAGTAPLTDPNLIVPWGLAEAPTSPIWVADDAASVATLYNGGTSIVRLVVAIPASGNTAPAPTGVVFNTNTTSFGGALFLFATQNGTIDSWSSGTVAAVQAATAGADYTGLTIANNGTGDLIYAANFSAGRIDVFNSVFQPVTVTGGFVDPNLPAGFTPFDVKTINGNIYVTYARAGGAGGFVDVFDTNGNLLQRLASNGALNSPWGLALAPADFGTFSNDLLVGNSGNGTIDAFDPTSGNFLGQLDDAQGNPIVIDGLLGLLFGNGSPGGGATNELFFAGTPGGNNGLLGDITAVADVIAVPEPSALALFVPGLILLGFFVGAHRGFNRAQRADSKLNA
jgi:uncharacterized protein (TIGR03118 family)